MTPKNRFKVVSFRTAEPRALKLAARELGHGLRTRSCEELAAIRGELSSIAPERENEYMRGFLDAVEHLLTGYSAELKHQESVTDEV
ncbi:MAG: hypothetical protein AB7V46_11795 [Thermomicrobiales bacterium]